MEKFTLKEGEAFIELNKLLKVLAWVGTGGEAKVRIRSGEISVNNEVESRLRKKLVKGDTVQFEKQSVTIEQ